MTSDDLAFLGVVARLGNQIADSAIWFEDRCNWVGAVDGQANGSAGHLRVEALGPDLYGGTSGIALFLAEAGRKLDDNRFRMTARAAMRHALGHAERIERESWDGLYGGAVGIAYAAARVGRVLRDEESLAGARRLLAMWLHESVRSESSDLITGCAGAVMGLLALAELVEEPPLIDTATHLGEVLIARAESMPAGWSWAAPKHESMQNLCGYSHGAAGIGVAFAHLFSVTGCARFKRASERAFDYERSWFNSQTGTWPDLRGVARAVDRRASLPAANSWCNGTPGIALSRLSAGKVLDSEDLLREAELALAACEKYVSEQLIRTPEDFSLCHGVAGAADVLVHASVSPADPRRKLAAQTGRLGIDLFVGDGSASFPCGVPIGQTPGLLLGFSGVGAFYLRLSDPSVPSPLSPPFDA